MFSFFRRKKTADSAPAAPEPAEALPAPPVAPSGQGERVHTTYVFDEAEVPLDELERQALAAGQPAAPSAGASPEPQVTPDFVATPPDTVPTKSRFGAWFGGAPAPQVPAPAPVSVAKAPAGPAPSPSPAPVPPPPAAAAPAPAAVPTTPQAIPAHELEAMPLAESTQAARAGWMDRLRGGLKKTGSSITTVFTGTRIDDALYEDLETALLMADAGVPATELLLQDLKRRVKEQRATEPAQVKTLLQDAIADLLAPLEKPLVVGVYHPTVIMVAGVNGAGKTTSIGKLTKHFADAGANVLLAAADTFRAAAREQLAVWADRNRVEIISQQGADPSAVSFDAVAAGRARDKDVVLVDTAGRLPTQKHLMEELTKIRRVVTKADITAPHEVLLVIDGNTGQNALAQVKAFDEAVQLTGLVVTKLDGTAKGGVLCAIARWGAERAGGPVPVYFIGVGEQLPDLQNFRAREFAQALVG